MNITRKQEGTTMTIALDDRLDTLTAPQLDTDLRNWLTGVETLIFDFSDLEFITSAGLRVLIRARRMLDGNMKVIHANETVRAVFELTGLDEMLSVE